MGTSQIEKERTALPLTDRDRLVAELLILINPADTRRSGSHLLNANLGKSFLGIRSVKLV